MLRSRCDGALGGGIVLLSRDRHDRIAIAVSRLEDGPCDVGPAPRSARTRAVIGAVGGVRLQEVEYGRGHVPREGEPAQLVVDHGDPRELVVGVRHAVGERGHGPHEVPPVAYDPAGAQHVVPGAARHGEVARGLGLAVDGEGAEGLILRVWLLRPVEDVVARHVHERDAVLRAGPREQGRPRRVRPPAGGAALRRLGLVDRRPGAAVHDRAVEVPVVAVVLGGV